MQERHNLSVLAGSISLSSGAEAVSQSRASSRRQQLPNTSSLLLWGRQPSAKGMGQMTSFPGLDATRWNTRGNYASIPSLGKSEDLCNTLMKLPQVFNRDRNSMSATMSPATGRHLQHLMPNSFQNLTHLWIGSSPLECKFPKQHGGGSPSDSTEQFKSCSK